jgi:dTMP kinase
MPKKAIRMTPETELLLFAASRAQIVREKIRRSSKAACSSSSTASSTPPPSIRAIARGLPLDAVNAINRFAIGGTLPQLTFVARSWTAPTAWQRIHANRSRTRPHGKPSRPSFFEKVRQGYLSLAKAEPERIQIIDANAPRPRRCMRPSGNASRGKAGLSQKGVQIGAEGTQAGQCACVGSGRGI